MPVSFTSQETGDLNFTYLCSINNSEILRIDKVSRHEFSVCCSAVELNFLGLTMIFMDTWLAKFEFSFLQGLGQGCVWVGGLSTPCFRVTAIHNHCLQGKA